MSAQPRILVVEDDNAIRRGIVDALRIWNYEAREAANGKAGLAAGLECEPDLVLLDVLMPGMDGFAVLSELRKARPWQAVIMLTARGTEEDRVRGLTGGADDYVVKPFGLNELKARIEAVLRRSAERPRGLSTGLAVLRIGTREVDFDRREVRFDDGRRGVLSEKESGVLRFLAENPGRAVSREELLSRVWGLDPRGVQTRTVDMQVARLREAIGDDPDNPTVIQTVRGRGYMLVHLVKTA